MHEACVPNSRSHPQCSFWATKGVGCWCMHVVQRKKTLKANERISKHSGLLCSAKSPIYASLQPRTTQQARFVITRASIVRWQVLSIHNDSCSFYRAPPVLLYLVFNVLTAY
jgi:hypothetical protein